MLPPEVLHKGRCYYGLLVQPAIPEIELESSFFFHEPRKGRRMHMLVANAAGPFGMIKDYLQ